MLFRLKRNFNKRIWVNGCFESKKSLVGTSNWIWTLNTFCFFPTTLNRLNTINTWTTYRIYHFIHYYYMVFLLLYFSFHQHIFSATWVKVFLIMNWIIVFSAQWGTSVNCENFLDIPSLYKLIAYVVTYALKSDYRKLVSKNKKGMWRKYFVLYVVAKFKSF